MHLASSDCSQNLRLYNEQRFQKVPEIINSCDPGNEQHWQRSARTASTSCKTTENSQFCSGLNLYREDKQQTEPNFTMIMAMPAIKYTKNSKDNKNGMQAVCI